MSLYDQIASYEYLMQGWKRTRENSGMAGTDHVTARMFELRLERELAALEEELQARTYTPRPLLGLDIPKPDGGFRQLAIPIGCSYCTSYKGLGDDRWRGSRGPAHPV